MNGLELERRFIINDVEFVRMLREHQLLFVNQISQRYLDDFELDTSYSDCCIFNFKYDGKVYHALFHVSEQDNKVIRTATEHPVCRIRKIDDELVITLKYKQPVGNYEIEFAHSNYHLSRELAKDPKAIHKTRFNVRVDIDKPIYQIDVFKQFSFTILEVELQTEELYNAFKPDFEGNEITNQSEYSNYELSKVLK